MYKQVLETHRITLLVRQKLKLKEHQKSHILQFDFNVPETLEEGNQYETKGQEVNCGSI